MGVVSKCEANFFLQNVILTYFVKKNERHLKFQNSMKILEKEQIPCCELCTQPFTFTLVPSYSMLIGVPRDRFSCHSKSLLSVWQRNEVKVFSKVPWEAQQRSSAEYKTSRPCFLLLYKTSKVQRYLCLAFLPPKLYV